MTTTKSDSYYDELEAEKTNNSESDCRTELYDGNYEASKGDFEGAILARDEFNAGHLS